MRLSDFAEKSFIQGVRQRRYTMRKIYYASMLLALVAVAVIPAGETQAYQFTGWKQCTFYVKWLWHSSITSVHKEGFQQALTDWNGAQGKRKFSNGFGNVQGYLGSYTDLRSGSANGYTDGTRDANYCFVAWEARLNTFKTTDFTQSRSTGGHELGHALGLAHEPIKRAVMNDPRNRYAIYRPQQDDINGVNVRY